MLRAIGFFATRYAFCVGIAFLPIIAIFAFTDAQKLAVMLSFVPLAGTIPTLISAMLVLAPIEALCARRGQRWRVNFYVPLAAAVCALLTLAAFSAVIGSFDVFLRNTMQDPAGSIFWVIIGLVWGVVWRISSLVRLLVRPRSDQPEPQLA